MKARNLIALAAVTGAVVVLAALAVLNRERASVPAPPPESLFPGLIDRVNEVSAITVDGEKGRFTVRRVGEDRWVVPEKDDYPVRFETAKKAVLDLASLKTLEAKTAKPEFHQELGLVVDGPPQSRATRIALEDADGGELAALLIGKRRYVGTGTRHYVRKPDEDQTWLVSGLDVEVNPVNWLDLEMFKINRMRVARVTTAHPDGATLVVYRDDPKAEDFAIADMPAGTKPRSRLAANDVAGVFEWLSFDDVKPRHAIDFARGAVVTELRTFDGLLITARTVAQDDKTWVSFSAAFDRALARAPAGDADRNGEAKALRPPEEVEKEAADINARLGGWAYVVAGPTAKNLTRTVDDLVIKESKESAS